MGWGDMGALRKVWIAAASSAVVAAGSVAVFVPGASTSASSTPPAPDKVVYVQQSGNNKTYLQYVPGDGSKATTQAVTGGGGCATPDVKGSPVLLFGARVYPNGYGGAANSAIVGAYNQRTGVCALGQAWAIEPTEGLTFSVGSNSLTAGRLLASASLALQRNDKTAGSASAQLVMRRNGVVVATKAVTVPAPSGALVQADTGITSGFDQLEVQLLSPAAGSISVSGASNSTSTFTFANQLCVSQTIQATSTGGTTSSGEVSASITYETNVDAPVCKPYTDFSASSTASTLFGKLVNFSTAPTTGARLSAHIDWGDFPYCRPDAAVSGVPTCPTTYIDLGDGNGEQPQAYCDTANPPATPAWCTTNRQYIYERVAGVLETRIIEDWSGFGDPKFALR
jgi:hypothetical protein